MSIRHSIISRIADGNFHSGESLAKDLNVSRASIWQHIKALEACGLDIHAVQGKGYRLSHPIELLNSDALEQRLVSSFPLQFSTLDYFPDLESTNQFLLNKMSTENIHGKVCLTEYQSQGRGRQGRSWVSPYAHGLCLSVGWHFQPIPDGMSGLGLAIGVALAQALQSCGVASPGLKWPNDIVIDNRKLAGILIDMQLQGGGSCDVVIGVGLNIHATTDYQAKIDQPWAVLEDVVHSRIERNVVAETILISIFNMLITYAAEGFSAASSQWAEYDLLRGKDVNVNTGEDVISGRMQGVDENGALLLVNAKGQQRFFSGDVSVRLRA